MGKHLVTFIYLNVKLVRTRDSPRKKFSENTQRGGGALVTKGRKITFFPNMLWLSGI